MKKIILGIILVGIIGLGALFSKNYNKLVKAEESTTSLLAQIDSNIQRKMDLLPNLIKLVKKYGDYESKTLKEITELRTNKSISSINKIQNKLNTAFSNLSITVEKYPNLKTSEQYLQLSAQIEGAENRINITRMQYNDGVKEYNSLLRSLPTNIIGNMSGFKEKEYFKTEKKKINLDI